MTRRYHQGLSKSPWVFSWHQSVKHILTVSEQQAAKGSDRNKDGTDAIKAKGEPAGCGQKQEPGFC